MSVNVKLIDGVSEPTPDAPAGFTVSYGKAEDGPTYEYEIHPSGALAIRQAGQKGAQVVYAPGAWLKVTGGGRGRSKPAAAFL